jgi:1-deoxy-D-xylulose-5-phosphate reductoisomerase
MKKNIAILGSTGSIGLTTLDVVSQNQDDFNIVALSAGSNYKLLAEQANKFKPNFLCIGSEDLKKNLEALLIYKTNIYTGIEGLKTLIKESQAKLILNAIVGAAGLLPTISVLECGKDLALANKESLVIAGQLVKDLAIKNNAKIIPVDSEHNAIFQCLKGNLDRKLKQIVLTGSGGPLLNYPLEKFKDVTPQQALNHPTWGMGKKISIDSATMVNKGLEIIEAKWLFNIDIDNIDVVIHPQSIVHGMVEFYDGSYLCMLGPRSMSVPIIYSLYYPDYAKKAPVDSLQSCRGLNLEFNEPDFKKFPALKLAREVAKTLGTAPAVFNASNEVAVQAFLDGKIKFTQIIDLITKVLDKHKLVNNLDIDVLLEADSWARKMSEQMCC